MCKSECQSVFYIKQKLLCIHRGNMKSCRKQKQKLNPGSLSGQHWRNKCWKNTAAWKANWKTINKIQPAFGTKFIITSKKCVDFRSNWATLLTNANSHATFQEKLQSANQATNQVNYLTINSNSKFYSLIKKYIE